MNLRVATILVVVVANTTLWWSFDKEQPVNGVGSCEKQAPPLQAAKNKSKTRPTSRIADFLHVGAPKAGSSAVFYYLKNHHTVCHPTDGNGKLVKESHFFDRANRFHPNHTPAQLVQAYAKSFELCRKEQKQKGNSDDSILLIDTTPRYLIHARKIHKLYQQHGTADKVKILIVLREPMSRELSWYYHLVRLNTFKNPRYARVLKKPGGKGNNNTVRLQTFQERMESLVMPRYIKDSSNGDNMGLYAQWLRPWLELFDRSQIWIAPYQEVKRDPAFFLARLHAFLDLPITATTSLGLPRYNHEHAPDEDVPSCALLRSYADYFEPHNEELYRLLDQHSQGAPAVETQPFPRFQVRCQEPPATTELQNTTTNAIQGTQ